MRFDRCFEAYGTVDRVSIVTDPETGRARGFGFVEMSADDEGERAIAALNGRELDGRALNINEARPKEDPRRRRWIPRQRRRPAANKRW